MKSLIREHIRKQIHRLLEDKEYKLRSLSSSAADALGPGGLNIPPSAIIDVKIIKAPRPIFKCFLENGQTFNIIDNDRYMQADINRILFDLDRYDDLNGAKYELEKLMQKGQFKQDDEELASDEGNIISNEPAIETEPEEPEA
jgi:hypothetical protein